MSRSKWKGPYLNQTKINAAKSPEKDKQNNFLIASRNSEILPKFIGMTFKIHNGKIYSELTITDEMVGHKFGEFSFTRGRFSFKKKKSKK